MLMMENVEEAQHAALCCPECSASNSPRRKFCLKCGTALWEPCLRCGELCAACETYCGACGANLPEMAAEQVELAETDIEAAEDMVSAYKLDEAISLLARISKSDHPRLAKHAARARELIARTATDRRQQRAAAADACQLARQLLAAFNYDGAAKAIETVPPPLQSDDVHQLRNEISARRQEIATVTEQLHKSVREKRLLELPSQIERLLRLKPDHAYAKRLAEQVQKPLVTAATKMLAEHRYDQAQCLLDKMPTQTDTSDIKQFRLRCREMAWLAWDVRNAPVIDETLLAVAERLRRLSPNDARNVKLCDELSRRIALAKTSQQQQPIQWARPPEQTPLGVPVEWLAGLRRIVLGESLDRFDLQRHPGRFAIGCGLALAGLQRAALQINLLPTKSRGMLRRVANAMRSRNANAAWGIDLGASGLKAVKLIWNEARQQAIIENAVFIEHAKTLSHAANEAEETKLVSETLKTFLDAHPIGDDRVCVSLPGRMTLSRQIKVPPVDAAKAAQLIQFEAAHQFPFPLEQLAWDFQLFNDAPVNEGSETDASGEKDCRAILVAARRTTTQHLSETLERLGVRVDVMQTDFVALHNFLAFDYFPSLDDSSAEVCPVAAAIDIGADVTSIVISSPNSLWFHSCGVAGNSFTRALVKEFKLSVAQAEQRKRSPETAEEISELYEAMSPVFDDLLREIQESLAAYNESQPHRPVQRVLGLGGGFSLHGLFRYLRCGR